MKSLLIFLTIFTLGCATSSVTIDVFTIEYKRLGDQHLKGVTVHKINADGSSFKIRFESQDSEATALNNAITVLGGLAREGK